MNYYLEVLRKYAVFDGRARRKEYWYFTLINGAILVILPLFLNSMGNVDSLVTTILTIYGLATFLPVVAVSVRRLHDTGRSGWWLLITVIPFVGSLVIMFFACLPSEPGANRYGPNPITQSESVPRIAQ